MLSRERVIQVIEHKKPDRIPVYAWVKANLTEPITREWGSVEAFEDQYEFDMSHLFGGPPIYAAETLTALSAAHQGTIEPAHLLEVTTHDPNNMEEYKDLVEQIRYYKEEKGRFVYVQTPGIFEALNGVFGIENHLAYLALYEDEIKEVYQRQAEWNRQFAMNCIDLGVDMVHVSDDWGAQRSLMFSPRIWRNLIFPYHKITCDAVRQRGCYVSLHSDGNVNSVLDGIVELGFHVVHPYQESSGMDFNLYREKYMDKFTVLGGLDVQTTIGFGNLDNLAAEIDRILEMFKDGGLLYCTTHFIQDHCSIEELRFAFDRIYEKVRK